MASKGKKITLLDQSGMLSKEALLGYVYGGLSPAAHAEVEKLIAQNEMYADMAEGLKHIPDQTQAEKIMHALNVEVAERSGSMASVPGLGANVGEFFWNYRRVAAVVGSILLLSAAVLTFALLKVSNTEMAMKEEPQKEEPAEAAETEMLEPAKVENRTKSVDSTQQTIAALEKNNVAGREFSEDDIDAVMQTGGAVSGLSAGTNSADNKKKETKDKEDKKQPATGMAETQADGETDTIANQNFAMADEVALDNSGVKNEDLAKEEQTYNDVVIAQSKKGTLSNTAGTQETYLKDVPLTQAEQMPVFPGGDAAFIQYLHNNLKYPQKAKADGVEGSVYVRFVIGTTGKVKDIVVIQGINKEINAEAIRLIAAMPKWEPGKQGGKVVTVMLHQTIEFKIE